MMVNEVSSRHKGEASPDLQSLEDQPFPSYAMTLAWTGCFEILNLLHLIAHILPCESSLRILRCRRLKGHNFPYGRQEVELQSTQRPWPQVLKPKAVADSITLDLWYVCYCYCAWFLQPQIFAGEPAEVQYIISFCLLPLPPTPASCHQLPRIQ